jgi:hypothetical protein
VGSELDVDFCSFFPLRAVKSGPGLTLLRPWRDDAPSRTGLDASWVGLML